MLVAQKTLQSQLTTLNSYKFIVLKPAPNMQPAEFNRHTVSVIQQAASRLIDQQSALIVESSSPLGSLSMVRKYWRRAIRRLENARASTLDLAKRRNLEHELEVMQSLPFSISHPDPDGWGVFFVETEI
ncbi:MAG TPA: hypothetical protein VNX65_01885 [Patescibacteria group bacterium]|jgi:hypothetical protein|nr:hypothetical protein [Patescibacteria group bacterium]